MEKITYVRGERGAFGLLIALIFWGFHAGMIIWIGSDFLRATQTVPLYAADVGAATFYELRFLWMLGYWVAGAIILGSMMLCTQGPIERVVKEEDETAGVIDAAKKFEPSIRSD